MELDYVTTRKPQRANSLDSLFMNNSTLLDSTMTSLPSTSMNDNDTITNLNETIKRLTMELQTAHREIEDLNSENFRLKMDIGEGQKIIKTYKKILSSDMKTTTPLTSRKRNLIRMNRSTHSTPQNHVGNSSICTYTSPLKTQGLQIPIYHDKSPSASTQHPSNLSEDTRHDGNNCNAENKVVMLNKETQTSEQTYDDGLTQNKKRTLIPHLSDVAIGKTSGVFQKQKNKLAIMSSGCTKGTLPLIEEVFSDSFQYCHFLLPNVITEDVLSTIEHKLKGFSINDYCLIFIGENDLKNDDFIGIIEKLRKYLIKNTHTNLVVCAPTFICGALIHNYKVELFNNLLCWDINNNRYAYFFDSNHTLSLEMFSINTGKINKHGWKNIFEQIRSNITYDYEVFSSNEVAASEEQLRKTNNMVTLSDPNELSATQQTCDFFRN